MPDTSVHDLAQVVRPLIPSFLGVVAGMLARWSREAKRQGAAARGKSLRRMMLLDLPTLGALTLVAGAVAQHLQADPLTAAGIGTGAGYLGMEVINSFVAWRTGLKLSGPGGGEGRGDRP